MSCLELVILAGRRRPVLLKVWWPSRGLVYSNSGLCLRVEVGNSWLLCSRSESIAPQSENDSLIFPYDWLANSPHLPPWSFASERAFLALKITNEVLFHFENNELFFSTFKIANVVTRLLNFCGFSPNSFFINWLRVLIVWHNHFLIIVAIISIQPLSFSAELQLFLPKSGELRDT